MSRKAMFSTAVAAVLSATMLITGQSFAATTPTPAPTPVKTPATQPKEVAPAPDPADPAEPGAAPARPVPVTPSYTG
jgi:hypothetical protein